MAKKLTPKQKDYREKLRKAIKLVKKTHWTKGSYRVRKGSYTGNYILVGKTLVEERAEKDLFCTIGLVRHVDGGQGRRALENYVRKVFGKGRGHTSVESWNDAGKREREDVVALLQTAHDEVPTLVK